MNPRTSLILTLLLVSLLSQAQLTLEKVYDYSLTSTMINQTDYKYFLMDVTKSECRIYNTDYSLWKTIPVALPSGYYLYDIKFVSQNLFNSDGMVELWYSAYEWVSTGTSTGYYRYVSKVINEIGTSLASVTGGAYAYVVPAGTDIYKMIIYAYDNSVSPATIKTYLFSLPNPSSAIHFLSSVPGDPWPNPASESINLPVNIEKGTIQVFSVSGQKMMESEISGNPVYPLNTRGWSPGIYTYRLVRNGQPMFAKQFVIR
jgi:hypothetical protein